MVHVSVGGLSPRHGIIGIHYWIMRAGHNEALIHSIPCLNGFDWVYEVWWLLGICNNALRDLCLLIRLVASKRFHSNGLNSGLEKLQWWHSVDEHSVH